MKYFLFILIVLSALPTGAFAVIPNEFISFNVPGYEKEMEQIRNIYYDAYKNPIAAPGAAFCDVWIPVPLMSVSPDMNNKWKNTFLTRSIDSDGYVSCHQHYSHALDKGWPFPLFPQLHGNFEGHSFGYIFQTSPIQGMLAGFAPSLEKKGCIGKKAAARWTAADMTDNGIKDDAWELTAAGDKPYIETQDGFLAEAFCCPYISFRAAVSTDKPLTGILKWQREGDSKWSSSRQVKFDLQTKDPFWGTDIRYCTIEPAKNKAWNGNITKLRIEFPAEKDITYKINSIFSAFDTRHQMNTCNFLIGSIHTFCQTGDTEFLKNNIERMRKVFDYGQKELFDSRSGMIKVRYYGHDGLPGYITDTNGKRTYYNGHSIGGNYWDILPFGNLETYTSYYYIYVLHQMADLEEFIADNPQLGITSKYNPSKLRKEANTIKQTINTRLWNSQNGRFYGTEDINGSKWDFGFTFLNTEAIYYGGATDDHAREIMEWIDGRRIVSGDTSQGADIYRWQLAPRATTLRNDKWYFWAWDANVFPFGRQVQDGGAVFAQSFNDLMSRIKVFGANNAWQRYLGILSWYEEVQKAGGYRQYYADGTKGNTMQGSGSAGGIGIDMEFVETILVPYTMIEGFMGFKANPEGFSIIPNLPESWPNFEIKNLHFRDSVLTIKANRRYIEIFSDGPQKTIIISVPEGASIPEGKNIGKNKWETCLGSKITVVMPQ